MWFRKNSILLSRETHTGMEFWLRQTIRGLNSWIETYNLVAEELKEEWGQK